MELSNEVFEYAHNEVSGFYAGQPIDVALMKEHKDLKWENAELRKAIKGAHEMMSGLGYTQDEQGRKYLCGNEYPWLEKAWNIIKSAQKMIEAR